MCTSTKTTKSETMLRAAFHTAVNAQLRAEEITRLRSERERLFKQALVDLGMTPRELVAELENRGPRHVEVMAHLISSTAAYIRTPEGQESLRQVCEDACGK
ncbi:MAG: hypothetical protein AVDCRST_MAG93-9899 [uncultured Chloroflexia bacterium]|uniref:Uncharacterized protein n=1 Tax=uncultured Chloroflexia bacterium TaxID=1672391 RepID=A0A6J4NT50_9CHLR|nr:MAG: hypothetical protein AVDCRST_MAG93-9899 [uncultured Chloroflexia bacterium]